MSDLEAMNRILVAWSLGDASDLVDQYGEEAIVPGACTTDGCDYCTEEVDAEEDAGYCPECEENSVKSCLVL